MLLSQSTVSVNLPQDLHDFIARGAQLTYDASDCEPGRVTLISLDQVETSLFSMDPGDSDDNDDDPHRGDDGCYLVEGIDLLQDADGGYGHEGVLFWLPQDRRYATWDSSHNKIHVFAEQPSWSDIAHSPVRFLNAQWDFGDGREYAPIAFLKPWPHHVFNPQQVHRKFHWPSEWFTAKQTLRGEFTNGVQVRQARSINVELEASNGAVTMRVTVNHLDERDWVVDRSFSRSLSETEHAALRATLDAGFWSGGKLKRDLGETLVTWKLEGLGPQKRYRSLIQFYSQRPTPDCVSEVGCWILRLADVPPLSIDG